MLKFKITKTAYDKLSDDMKEHYKVVGDVVTLDVDGLPEPPDTATLTRTLDRVRAELDDAKEELGTTTKELTTIKATMSDSDRDVQKLQRRYEAKLADQNTDFTAKLATKDKIILDGEIGRTADALASKISTSPAVIKPHIIGRLHAEFDADGKPVVRVLKDGKPDAALTVEKLGEEFVANKDFAGIIRASNASGGRTPAPLGTPPVAGVEGQQPTLLTKLTTEQMVAHVTSVKAAQNAA
jgi:hypothetical protein